MSPRWSRPWRHLEVFPRSLAPQFLRRNARAFGHRLKLRPTHLGMTDSGADAAVGAGDDIFASHDFSVTHQAIRDRLGMFDEIAVVTDHAGNKNFSVRQ